MRQECALIPDEPVPHDPPSAIGPFRVLHQLGAGALGPVYRAFDPDRDRLVAIKVFRLDVTPEQTAELAGTLDTLSRRLDPHPSIAMPVQAGIEGTSAYLVQQYVPFDTLDMHLRRGGTGNADEALALLAQVAEALAAAARVGVHHGALHPRDILVSTTGDVLVTGLGVAEALEAVGVRAPVRRPYAAPERVEGAPWDHRADVFTLAVLAFEMLTGRQPAGTGSVAAAQFELEDAEIDIPLWHRALATGMAESPDERFPSVGLLLDALGGTPSGQPEAPVDESPAPPGELPDETEAALARLADEPDWAVASDEPPDQADEDFEVSRAAAATPVDDVALAHAPVETGDAPGGDRSLIDLMDEAVSPQEVAPGAPAAPAAPRASAWTPSWQTRATDDASPVVPSPPARHETRPRWPDDQPAPHREGRPWVVPALGTMAGLLLGVLLGYAIWGRTPVVATPPAPGSAAPVSTPAERPPVEPEPTTPQQIAPPEVIPEASQPTAAATVPAAPRREPSAPSARTAAARGRLSVRSSPSGARVSLNGRPRGTTPFDARDLALGSYDVEVARPGYAPSTRRVTLTERSPTASFSVTLVEGGVPPAGGEVRGGMAALDIVSKPAGARVVLDGAFVGLTPLRLPELASGPHTVRLELDGHRPWTTTVTVAAGQTERVAASLEQEVPR